MKLVRSMSCLFLCFVSLETWAASTYSLPIPQQDKRPISLNDQIPLKLNETTATVVGEYGGMKFFDSAVPIWKRGDAGDMQDTNETIPVGTGVNVLAFVRFKGRSYYRLESQAKTTDLRFVEGRFLTVPAEIIDTKLKPNEPPK